MTSQSTEREKTKDYCLPITSQSRCSRGESFRELADVYKIYSFQN